MIFEKLFKVWYFSGWTLLKARSVLLLALSFIICGVSLAQDEGIKATLNQHLGLHFDTGIHSFREDLLVPLGFNGPGVSLGGVYNRQKDNKLFTICLKLSAGYLKNRYSHEAGLATLELRPSWLWRVNQNKRFGDFWAGICVPLQMNSDLGLHSWDDAHLYWLTAYSFGLAMEWQKSISQKNIAILRMETPLMGWVSRPPSYRYLKQERLTHFSYQFSELNRSLLFETLDTYRALYIQMQLVHELPSSLLSYGIEFQYNYCNRPQNIYILNTSMFISYQWRIGQ
jgi:hypothetical protein